MFLGGPNFSQKETEIFADTTHQLQRKALQIVLFSPETNCVLLQQQKNISDPRILSFQSKFGL